MGLYATVFAEVRCPTCASVSSGEWQFYFGDVSELPEYRVGETIQWSGYRSRELGSPEMIDVVAVGYLADEAWCATCAHSHVLVDISIRASRIEAVSFRSFEPWTRDVLFVGPERTPVLPWDGRPLG